MGEIESRDSRESMSGLWKVYNLIDINSINIGCLLVISFNYFKCFDGTSQCYIQSVINIFNVLILCIN
jgi:hypothetical protein